MAKVSHGGDCKFCLAVSRDTFTRSPWIIISSWGLEEPGWATSRGVAVRAVRLTRAEECSLIGPVGSWRGWADPDDGEVPNRAFSRSLCV
jgi:hypothetical protein